MNLNCETELCYKIIKQKITHKEAKEYRVTEEDQDQDEMRTVAKGWGARWNETLWHNKKGDTDYKTHQGKGEQVETIRKQGRQSD